MSDKTQENRLKYTDFDVNPAGWYGGRPSGRPLACSSCRGSKMSESNTPDRCVVPSKMRVNPVLQPVLDACCGPRMFWFDRKDPRALFIDNRRETHAVDVGTPGTIGRSPIVIDPDHLADFTALPFEDSSFHLVVFDPPHVQRKEARGAVTRKFGVLNGDWREMLRAGFRECFRVLKPHGVLVFKWGESQFSVSEILKLTPHRPLFGHKTRKTTHWCVFMKEAA